MRHVRSQRGETLIEGLIAILLLSLVAAAAYAGLQTSIRSSAQHKESAVAETLLRTAAERLQDPGSSYINRAGCGGVGTYTGVPNLLPTEPGYALSATVRFWVPTSAAAPQPIAAQFVDCPANDPGLQQVRLTVVTPGGFTDQLDVLKRRSGT
jgi:type II secretory pathway pseudopilin PulG